MIRRHLLPLLLMLPLLGQLALTTAVSAQTPTAATHWQPARGLSWQIQFSEELAGDPLPVAVYDLDGFDTDAETVAALHAQGTRVLCYVNMGAWEDWRPDAEAYPEEVIGNAWEEWEGERFIDIRRLDVLAPILEARLDMCRDKGFDAVEPDNIDTAQNDPEVTGFELTDDDQVRFNRWLAEAAHARGLAIGQKNIPDLTAQLIDVYDFAVTEDCFVDGWCDDVRAYLDANKPVFAIEYTDTDADLDEICPQAAAAGYSVVLKHRELDAWRETCPATEANGCDQLGTYVSQLATLIAANDGLARLKTADYDTLALSAADADTVVGSLTTLIAQLGAIAPPDAARAYHAAYVDLVTWYRDLAEHRDAASHQRLIDDDKRIVPALGMAVAAGQATCSAAVWDDAFTPLT